MFVQQHRIHCAFTVGLLAVTVLNPVADAGGGRSTPVADLRFTVSDPLPPTGSAANTFLPPACLDANGLVAGKLTIGGSVPILWDSTTGVVNDLRTSVTDPPPPPTQGFAVGVNAQRMVIGFIQDHLNSYVWDASVEPIQLLGPIFAHFSNQRVISVCDAGHILSETEVVLNGGALSAFSNTHPFGGAAQVFDINDTARITYFLLQPVPKPYRIDAPFVDIETDGVPLPMPTAAELGFPPSTAAPYAINRYKEIVGLVEGSRLVRWNADDSYNVLDTSAYDRMDIADNGIILWKFGNAIVLYDPDTLQRSTLDSLVEPSGNPLNFIFTDGGSHIGGIDSNAAVTRIVALGFSLTLGAPRWVVLTAITPGRTDGADFEAGTLSSFDITGSGDAVIIDDPYTPGNHVLEMTGAVSASQPVSTPSESFAIGFRADVTALKLAGVSIRASLRVWLDDTLIGELSGGDLMNGAMTKQAIVVSSPSLMDRSEIPLRLEWSDPNRSGPPAIAILIDDIEFQGVCLADIVDTNTFLPPGDGVVDGADLAYLLGEWGDNPGSPADFVDSATFAPPPDDLVDGADLAVLLGAWGECD